MGGIIEGGYLESRISDEVSDEQELKNLEQKFFEFMLWMETLIVSTTPFLKSEDIFEISEYVPKTIKFKKAMGREKDIRDIELINKYLKNKYKIEK